MKAQTNQTVRNGNSRPPPEQLPRPRALATLSPRASRPLRARLHHRRPNLESAPHALAAPAT
eukprot:8952705-Heterocapsa_arctica.AAC.1